MYTTLFIRTYPEDDLNLGLKKTWFCISECHSNQAYMLALNCDQFKPIAST
jgi:hypothetical protein